MRYRSATVADSHGLPRCLRYEKERTAGLQTLLSAQSIPFPAQILVIDPAGSRGQGELPAKKSCLRIHFDSCLRWLVS